MSKKSNAENTYESDYEKICDFKNLYKAHKKARLGKQNNTEVIQFELNLGYNLSEISKELKEERYQMQGYYSFYVHDPKLRLIHALHYRDRIVQHALCDEVLAPLFEKHLIFDNAACRVGKGTHFAMGRVTGFLREHYKDNKDQGYFLKCDIRKYFDSIDHEILKLKLKRIVKEPKVFRLLEAIIDGYETTEGKGLPLGNQTSQWFALYYLDELDRLVKEKLGIKHYSRYMDDCLLIHEDKEYLKYCLKVMNETVTGNLQLEFNAKTQIFPIKNGVDYIGFHYYLNENGKVIRKVRKQTAKKYKRKLKTMAREYNRNELQLAEVKQVLSSYHAHFSHGHCYHLEKRALSGFVLTHASPNEMSE